MTTAFSFRIAGFLRLIAALLIAGFLLSARAADARPDPNFHLYLLIGQSNMAGRGPLDAESKEIHPRVMMLDKEMKWVPATDPLHFDKPIAAVGPGFTFGKAMAEADPKVKIGLVPCAMGGSKIEEWEPGQKNYEAMLVRMREAQKSGVLKGILWHQGESNLKDSSHYAEQLKRLISRVREAFGAADVPFVSAEITPFKAEGAEEVARLNAVLREVGKEVPRYACVGTGDLKDKGDKLHFDTASARALGLRYARAILEINKQPR
jgi:hypothetical protein